jgi:hypothetical protein
VGEKTAPWALFGVDEQGLGEIVEAVSICKAPAIDGSSTSQPAASRVERSCAGTGRGSNALGYAVAGVEIGWDGRGSRDAGFFMRAVRKGWLQLQLRAFGAGEAVFSTEAGVTGGPA